MATKPMTLTDVPGGIIADKCSYTANTITTNSLSGDTYARLMIAIPFVQLLGCEDATINKVSISYKGCSDRSGVFVGTCTVDTAYVDSSNVAHSVSNDKIGKGTSNPKLVTVEVSGSYLNNNILYGSDGTKFCAIMFQMNNPINTGKTIIYLTEISITIDYTLSKHTIKSEVSPLGSGTVKGAGTYECGSTQTLTAEPAAGYNFVKWNDDNTDITRTIKVTKNVTYTAYFEQIIPPKFTSAEMIYLDKQISSSNKVIANENFIIAVSVT